MRRGARKVNILIGGSATNDGGIGCAAALGYKFFDEENIELSPVGENLLKIRSFSAQDRALLQLIRKTNIIVYTDVINPITGKNGASFIYGPHKGATK